MYVYTYVCVQYIQIQCVSFYVRSALSTITTRSVSAHVAFRRRAWSNRVRDTFATRKRDANPIQSNPNPDKFSVRFAHILGSAVFISFSLLRQKKRREKKYIFKIVNFAKNSKSKLLTLEQTANRPRHTPTQQQQQQ